MNTYVKNTALLGILTVFTLFIIIWANLVELDEMSRVQGKIIPSSKEKSSNQNSMEDWLKLM